MKRRIAVAGIVLVLLGCSSATMAQPMTYSIERSYKSSYPVSPINMLFGDTDKVTLLERIAEDNEIAKRAEIARARSAIQNRLAIESRMKELSQYVGKTPYVFSGSTPSGWDCSGMIRWFYSEIGIELEHSATKQARSGTRVDEPVVGDLVAFKHFGSKKYYHIGIYIGDNKIIHSREPGTLTAIAEITDSWFDRSYVHFVRIVDTK